MRSAHTSSGNKNLIPPPIQLHIMLSLPWRQIVWKTIYLSSHDNYHYKLYCLNNQWHLHCVAIAPFSVNCWNVILWDWSEFGWFWTHKLLVSPATPEQQGPLQTVSGDQDSKSAVCFPWPFTTPHMQLRVVQERYHLVKIVSFKNTYY